MATATKKFGTLSIEAVSHRKGKCVFFHVSCDCGRVVVLPSYCIRRVNGCCDECPHRKHKPVQYKGEKTTLSELAYKFGMSIGAVRYRLKHDIPLEKDKGAAVTYRGKTTQQWASELGIKDQMFRKRLLMYGVNDERTYAPKRSRGHNEQNGGVQTGIQQSMASQ